MKIEKLRIQTWNGCGEYKKRCFLLGIEKTRLTIPRSFHAIPAEYLHQLDIWIGFWRIKVNWNSQIPLKSLLKLMRQEEMRPTR